MNDFGADPPGIVGHGNKVTELGGQIRTDMDAAKPGLECNTDGLNAPAILNMLATGWTDTCHAVSAEVTRAGEGTVAAGNDHAGNEETQTQAMLRMLTGTPVPGTNPSGPPLLDPSKLPGVTPPN